MADFSDAALQNVKTRAISARSATFFDRCHHRILKISILTVKRAAVSSVSLRNLKKKKVTELKAKYDKASLNVDKVAQSLQAHQILLMKDVATMDKMYSSIPPTIKN